MDENIKKSLMMGDKWTRLFFMVVYAIVNYIVQLLIWALAAVQFIFTLLASKPNDNLLKFTSDLTAFSYHMIRYLTYNEENRPYPFTPWSKRDG